jgi:tetratricopeptide (TPR) repeat protein
LTDGLPLTGKGRAPSPGLCAFRCIRSALAILFCAVVIGADRASAAEPTFTRDIAPLLWSRCGGCHHPDGSAPFSLIEYADVVPRARQIVSAVKSRLMPPWLPEPGYGEFSNERRLRPGEIDALERWVAGGTPRGPAEDLPVPPVWTDRWQLGTPDLVVSLSEPYRLPPGDADAFRVFVIPIPLKAPRHVRGVEIRPGNARVVHHASMSIDRTRGSRRLDEADAGPGFSGAMMSQGARNPEGRAIGWTPGISPSMEPDGMAWRLEAGADLVVELHMLPSRTGVTEIVQPSVGFYFTDAPPTRTPVDFKIGSKSIDIPAGRADYAIEDTYELPVDVDLLSIYPHAHYLARDMKASATRPDGTVVPLLWIRNWDFHWQDDYHYARPVFLPRGTRVTMRYTYDNSAANRRNAVRPPARVMFGPESTDEMGDLWLRFLPRTTADAVTLARSYQEHELAKDIALGEARVAANPREARWQNALALAYMQAGRIDAAAARLSEALRLQPENAEAHNNLGHVLQLQGRAQDAMPHFREAVRLVPDNDLVHINLANALQDVGEVKEAIPHYEEAIRLNPASADAHNNLGVALGSLGRLDEAASHFRQALEIQPDYGDARENLDQVLELLQKTVR